MRGYNKRRTQILWVGVVLLVIFAIGGVSAFMFKKTSTIENNFNPAKLSCSVSETFENDTKTVIRAKNDDESNIDAYLRVRLISYWIKREGEKEIIVGKPSEMPEFTYDDTKWVKSATEDVYYYIEAVAPGNHTDNLLKTGSTIVLGESSFNNETVYQVVEIFAEAIQSNPADAAQNSWGVTITDNKITAAP